MVETQGHPGTAYRYALRSRVRQKAALSSVDRTRPCMLE